MEGQIAKLVKGLAHNSIKYLSNHNKVCISKINMMIQKWTIMKTKTRVIVKIDVKLSNIVKNNDDDKYFRVDRN